MKKLLLVVVMALVTLFSVAAFAAENEKPNVAVMYINNAKTKFDADIDKVMQEELARDIPSSVYNYVDGSAFVTKLNAMGIMDISSAERSDIVDCIAEDDIDYVVFVEIQPMVRKEKVHFFNYGIEMTTQIPFKIIDVVNNRYLYNGKFVEKGEDSTVIGGLGNKGSAMKALDRANLQMKTVLAARLPVTKAQKINR